MATLFFCVFPGAGEVALGDPLQEDTVTVDATPRQSAAIAGTNRKRQRVRCYTDGACFVTWGANPTAVNDGSSGRPMVADSAEYFDIEAGYLIGVIERL